MCAGDPGHKEEGSQGGIAALGRLPEKGQFCYWLFHAQSTIEVIGWEDHLKKVSLLLDVQFPVHHGGCIRWGDYLKKVSVLLIVSCLVNHEGDCVGRSPE